MLKNVVLLSMCDHEGANGLKMQFSNALQLINCWLAGMQVTLSSGKKRVSNNFMQVDVVSP